MRSSIETAVHERPTSRTWLAKALIVALLSLALPSDARAALCGAGAFLAKPRPTVVVFSAPSGGGKTTLANLLLSDFPNLAGSVSSTTRAPRGQERDGIDYHFLSITEFKAKIARGDFAEWAEVHGNYYGTDKVALRSALDSGRSVLALVDVKGAESLRIALPGQVYTIFISPPDLATLESRLRGRGTETETAIQKRLAAARAEMAEAPKFDRVVVNGDLERAHADLKLLFETQGLVIPAQEISAQETTEGETP